MEGRDYPQLQMTKLGLEDSGTSIKLLNASSAEGRQFSSLVLFPNLIASQAKYETVLFLPLHCPNT